MTIEAVDLAFKISPTIDILKYVMFYFLSQTSFSSLNISPTFCVLGVQDNKVSSSELIWLLFSFQSREKERLLLIYN